MTHRPQVAPFRWQGVALQPYAPGADAVSHGVSRQTLAPAGDGMAAELRYFEVAPGGWSSLERHHHAHTVVIVRGRARVLVGTEVIAAAALDVVTVPPRTWHQFRPAGPEPMGFLCVVDGSRDRPERPDAAQLAALRALPHVAAFLEAAPEARP